VKPSKALPASLVQDAGAEEEEIVVPALAALSAPTTNGASEPTEQRPAQ
jgi:hypothetical protein